MGNSRNSLQRSLPSGENLSIMGRICKNPKLKVKNSLLNSLRQEISVNLLALPLGHFGRALLKDFDTLHHAQMVGQALEIALVLLLFVDERLKQQGFAGEVELHYRGVPVVAVDLLLFDHEAAAPVRPTD